jgi:hypothetical protein
MEQHMLPSPKGVLELGIAINCASIDSTEKVSEYLRILRTRFCPHILLGMAGMEDAGPIFQKWLATGIVDQIICSGHESLVLNDLVDAAIRSNAATTIFIDADDLQCAPSDVLRFIAENQGCVNQPNLAENARLWSAGQQKLRHIPKSRYPGEWNEGLKFVHAACSQELSKQVASVFGAPKSAATHHLFVTETGLKRLGGWEKFKTSPIRVGGLPIKEFGSVSVLTVELSGSEQAEFGKKIPSITKSDNGSVVFDIWPAPHSFTEISSQHDATVSVPRQILVGRRCSLPSGVSDNLQAVFIMSNFNKAAYLHAALYGWVMQTHQRIRLEIIDDISTDK